MGKHKDRKRMMGPWSSLHTAVWLIGIGLLAWSGRWWPGIIVLIGISMVIEALAARTAPQTFEPDELPASSQSAPSAPPAPLVVAMPPEPLRRLELLPTTCPNCGGPIRGHEVRWSGGQSADCPYCGTNLPMKKNPA